MRWIQFFARVKGKVSEFPLIRVKLIGGTSGGVLMPTGSRGEKRPADVIGAAIMVARIATGEITEVLKSHQGKCALGKLARKQEERRAIAKKAAAQRWG